MKRKIFFILVLGLAISMVGLSSESNAEEKAIKWGVISTLQREAGIGAKNATEMAAEEINAAGGILGRKVEVFLADDEGTPEKGITAVKKLLFQDNVDFISGGWLSGPALAEADYIFNAKKLWFSVGPATPKLASLVKENYEKAKYWFRSGNTSSDNSSYDLAVYADEFFKKELGLTKFALLAESSVWGREAEAIVKKGLTDRGLEIVFSDVFDPKRTDFSPQFAQIRDKGAQVLLTLEAASPGVPLTKQWATTKLPVHLIGFSSASTVAGYWEKTGGTCEYQVTLAPNGARAPLSPITIPFFDKYVKKYNTYPAYTAFGAYDSLFLLKAAAEQAKSLDTETLIKTLEKIRFPGTAGLISFTKDHEVITGKDGKMLAQVQWQKEKQTVVYPKEWAVAPYASPPWVKK